MGYQRNQQDKARNNRFRKVQSERDRITRRKTDQEVYDEMRQVARKVPLRAVYLNEDAKEQ
jgi:hypothetical protein